MRKLRIISLAAFLILALAGNSIADLPELVIWEGNGTYEIGSGKEWFVILELRTYDTVKVIMPGGGGK
jgi:hypothetical protein